MMKPFFGRTFRKYLGIGLGLSLLASFGLWWISGMSQLTMAIVLCWLTGVNLITFMMFGFDKWQARGGRERVPEFTLHVQSLLGGSFGAFLAMVFFRHKTIKGSFRILFGCIVLLQTAALAWLVQAVWWSHP